MKWLQKDYKNKKGGETDTNIDNDATKKKTPWSLGL